MAGVSVGAATGDGVSVADGVDTGGVVAPGVAVAGSVGVSAGEVGVRDGCGWPLADGVAVDSGLGETIGPCVVMGVPVTGTALTHPATMNAMTACPIGLGISEADE